MATAYSVEFKACCICEDVEQDLTSLFTCYHQCCQRCLEEMTRIKGVEQSQALVCPVCHEPPPAIRSLMAEKAEGRLRSTDLNIKSFDSDENEGHQTEGLNLCQEHRYRSLEYYCLVCDVFVCIDCGLTRHQKCKHIITVTEAGKKRRLELKNHVETLTFEHSKSEQRLQKKRELKENLCEQMKTIEMSIMKETEQAIAELREKESVLLQEVREKFDIEIQKISETIKTLETLSEAKKENIRLLNQLMTSGSDTDVITQLEKENVTIFSRENEVGMSKSDSMIKFVSNMSAVIETLKTLPMGEIVTVKGVITTKTPEDSQDPALIDVLAITVNDLKVIAVTDWNNKCVKCFYEQNNKSCFSRLCLDGQPWNVTLLSGNKIAVTLPWQCQICIISVTPELSRHSSVKTCERYYGLAAVNSTTFAAGTVGWSKDPARVDLIDISGNLIRSISTDKSGQRLFTWPRYLCVTPSSDIIVSDWNKTGVTCVTQLGEVKFKCKHLLNYPHGVSCDYSGWMFVVEDTPDKVVKMTADGKLVYDVMTSQHGLKSPQSVCFCDNYLYILHNSGEIIVLGLK